MPRVRLLAGNPNAPGAACFSSDAKCGLASVERLAPQVAAVELDQFGSLSLVVRVDLPHQRRPNRRQPNLLVPSGSIGVRLAVVGTGYPVERAVVSIF
jgi:hypothetical protein